MAKKMGKNEENDKLTQYTFNEEKRLNIPQTGLVSAETDPINGKKTYKFEPHLDPELQWAGKTEGTSFDVDTVSLHVHERIDPLTIIDAVRNKEPESQRSLFYYFDNPENNLPIREAIEFYKHSEGWSNRLIAGDSLIVMNSLLEKEGMAGKVQMIYIDPPYGIKYGSNFQPFVNKRDVKDGKDEDLTQEPETIKAFRDTWELGIHSYLTYLRNRLLLARDLLAESGSIFVQISDENVHHVREIMDEIFGANNFVVSIIFTKTGSHSGELLEPINNYILWYAKDKKIVNYNPLFVRRNWSKENTDGFNFIEIDGKEEYARHLEKIDVSNLYRTDPMLSNGYIETSKIELDGKVFDSGYNHHWKVSVDGIRNLYQNNRIIINGKSLYYKRYFGDFPVKHYSNIWSDTGGAHDIRYVVETNSRVIERCLLMTTNTGDLVFDPTCGSGTTSFAAEKYGRRWITCDTSRVAITLAKQRLMTAVFDYYELAHPEEGIKSGFNYEKVPHITLKSIANDEPPKEEILYDKPLIDQSKKRVSGPFTVEAVPSQRVVNLEDVDAAFAGQVVDNSIARSGETVRQSDWIDELSKTGIRAKAGQIIKFSRIETLQGTKWLQAQGETNDGHNAVISFGPAYVPLEQRQVELAIEEAQQLVPKPKLVIFASFQFDPEAAKDIDELKWPGVNVIKCQMNTDLLTEDLKKKRANEESSFWLIGQPDIELKKESEKYTVTVNGFDYYDTRTGEIKSGDSSNIAMWELDTDYNGRSLYPKQVFFPLEGDNGGWSKLAKALKAYIDEDLISGFAGNKSIPFKISKNKQIAVKIIDDRGIESLRVLRVE
jgi:adenine-specific DNA-methyltransferase